jgi:hypothetical protein
MNIQNIKTIILVLILTLCVGYVSASSTFTNPPTGTVPPSNNVATPLNTTAASQIKQGYLWIKAISLANGLIVENGNVGIGVIAAPAAKLDVVGSIKITDGTQGAGKVLTATTDGSGLASWQGGGGSLNQDNCAWTVGTCQRFGGTPGGNPNPINLSISATCSVGGYMVGSKTTICGLSQCSQDYCATFVEKVQAYCCYPSSFQFLYSKVHTPSDCTSAHGIVTSDGTNSFCKFTASSCPSTGEWTQYNNYSTTAANTCSGSFPYYAMGSCATEYHDFSNVPQESCEYYSCRSPLVYNSKIKANVC